MVVSEAKILRHWEVQSLKEGVRLKLLNVTGCTRWAQSLVGVNHEHAVYKANCIDWQVLWKIDVLLKDLLVDLGPYCAGEGYIPCNQLEYDASEGPNVCSHRGRIVNDHFWCEIVHRTYEGTPTLKVIGLVLDLSEVATSPLCALLHNFFIIKLVETLGIAEVNLLYAYVGMLTTLIL